MSNTEHRREVNAVDDVRAARSSLCEGGFASLREHLRRVREEFQSRTGRFADLPEARPEDAQQLIDAAQTDEPLLDEIRAARDAGFLEGPSQASQETPR